MPKHLVALTSDAVCRLRWLKQQGWTCLLSLAQMVGLYCSTQGCFPKATPSQEEEKEEDSRKLSETSAKLRAERLNILKTATASAATSAAAASVTATAAAAQTDEGDEEGFMHAAAVGKLPDHLVRSESQESDSDVITDRPDEDERQPAESEARLQQDPKRLQAFVRYM